MLRKIKLILCLVAISLSCFASEFIHGFYSVRNSDNAFQTMKDLGCTHVHAYFNPYTEGGLKNLQDQLDLAEKYGLKVMFNLIRGGVEKEDDGIEKIRAVVRRFKDHPALGFWYMFDEPSGAFLKNRLAEIYFMLKTETPDIPVALCLAQVADWRDFVEYCDILMGDVYPVRDEPFPNAPLYRYSGYIKQLSQYNKPVIGIPQFMNWTCYPALSKNDDQEKLRHPNAAELRYFFFSTMTQGNTTGMVWYSYEDILRANNIKYFKEMQPVMQEFRNFTDMLKNPTKSKAFTWSQDNNMYMSLFDNKYLVLVNDWPVRQKVSRWMENIIFGNWVLKPWGKTRDVKAQIQSNRLTIDGFIEPWEVFIWELTEKEEK